MKTSDGPLPETWNTFPLEHRGYEESFGVRHRRQVVFSKGEYWFILDDLTGARTGDTLSWYIHSPAELPPSGAGYRSATAPGLLVLPVLLLPAGAPRGQTAGTVVKLATLVPDGSVWDKILRTMGAEWTQATAGRVTLRVYPGGVAGDEPEVVRKIRIGQLHAAALTVTCATVRRSSGGPHGGRRLGTRVSGS